VPLRTVLLVRVYIVRWLPDSAHVEVFVYVSVCAYLRVCGYGLFVSRHAVLHSCRVTYRMWYVA
jgi:hypothetical protein